MEEKGPKVTEPAEIKEIPVKGMATQSGAPNSNDAALGPEEIARQLFASYLEPEAAQLELAAPLAADEELEPVDLPLGLLPEDHEGQEPEAEGEAEEPEEGGRHWYVIHSYSGYESKVKKNLEHRIESLGMHDRIFQVVVPTEEEIELKDGQRRTIERRIFPGYILVEM